MGATWPKRSHFGLVPESPKKWYPPGPILTCKDSVRALKAITIIEGSLDHAGSCMIDALVEQGCTEQQADELYELSGDTLFPSMIRAARELDRRDFVESN